jgi:repressor LexA|tara:strand:- start:633 stop:884 length:252 start_codon:yes stop_codon:yes gene_type:complete
MAGRNYKWLENDMLTPRQLKLFKFLIEYKKEHEVMPTFDDMKSFMQVKSKSVVYNMLGYIEWKGYIKREPAQARAIKILKEVV